MKVGDTVVICDCGERKKAVIARDTNTLFIVDVPCILSEGTYERKFRKKDGYEIGSYVTIRAITEADEIYFKHKSLLKSISEVNFELLSDEKLEGVLRLLAE